MTIKEENEFLIKCDWCGKSISDFHTVLNKPLWICDNCLMNEVEFQFCEKCKRVYTIEGMISDNNKWFCPKCFFKIVDKLTPNELFEKLYTYELENTFEKPLLKKWLKDPTACPCCKFGKDYCPEPHVDFCNDCRRAIISDLLREYYNSYIIKKEDYEKFIKKIIKNVK